MTITDRQNSILEKVVKEYIRSATPVSSQALEKRFGFGVCSATIRNDMQSLTEAGFLYQPHTSAGRVPTDKGYRFFVDKIFEKELGRLNGLFDIERIIDQEGKDLFRFASHLSKSLALASSSLAIIHLFDRDLFLKEGWEEVLKEPEFEERRFIEDFADLLKRFESNINNLDLSSEVKVYIGRENPFSEAKDFSVVSVRCIFPKKEEGVVSLLGPKRMRYRKNIGLMNSLMKVLEDF